MCISAAKKDILYNFKTIPTKFYLYLPSTLIDAFSRAFSMTSLLCIFAKRFKVLTLKVLDISQSCKRSSTTRL